MIPAAEEAHLIPAAEAAQVILAAEAAEAGARQGRDAIAR